jgi:DNA-directed RNA polymerase specialized sigma24 family protein
MNEQHDNNWRETSFTPEQWACVPSTASPWHDDSQTDPATEERLRTAEEIALLVHGIMVSALTHRQRRVLELHYLDDCTQVEIADALGIAQATVCQHLKGKRRGQTHVGGAFRKIRKAIHKAARKHAAADTRYAELVGALDQLLDASLTHRRARDILDALATHRRKPA